jgi:hypothetical protein
MLKPILLFLFLGGFINARSHNHTLTFEDKLATAKKIQEAKTFKKFTDTSEDDETSFKRKRKPRGVEVGIPVINVLTFDLDYTHNDLTPAIITNSDASFLYCVPSKRGPPLS